MATDVYEKMARIQEVIRQLNIHQSDNSSDVTNQFGYIKFGRSDIDSTTRLSQYIRLALQTDATTVVQFMKDAWQLPTPNLIISVTGGGKRCHMPAHLRKTFQRGLVAAAATTDAWIITAGTNAGVVKGVGEALNNYRYKNRRNGLDVPCIGIGTWKYTAGNDQLVRPVVDSSVNTNTSLLDQPAKFRQHSRLQIESTVLDAVDESYIRTYAVKQPEDKRCDLEPNHTHFLLFEGKSSINDTALLQRARIEKYSREINTTDIAGKTLVPIVMILVEGGPYSVRTICQALKSNTPLVVVKGTGRAADLVANLHLFFSEKETGNKQKSELNAILEAARSEENSWVDEIKEDLCQVLYQQKQLVVIFEFENPRHHGQLEDAILEAVFNGAKFSGDNLDEQMKLAMAWQKFDYAKKHILTDATISRWTENDLYEVLIEALHRNYVDFVILLMNYGTSLRKLTVQHLEELYASAEVDSGLPIDDKIKGDIPTREEYYACYFPQATELYRISSNKNQPLGQNATREFFLWAIFVDRFELAKYLCSKTWNPATSPLLAATIYRYALTMPLHTAKKQRYRDNATEFDKYATAIIDQCFHTDEDFAVDLLNQPAAAFDNVKPLQLAEEASCQTFLASECVQKYLDETWYGHINYKRRAINMRILLCTFFLPLLPLFSVFLPYVRKRQQIRNELKPQIYEMMPALPKFDQINTRNPIRWSKRIVYFYQAPIVRFFYNVIFFALFLGLFSYVLLIDYLPLNMHSNKDLYMKILPIPITEIALHICTWSLIGEEVYQFSHSNFYEYISSVWNLIDVSAIILYLIAFVTRFILHETFFMISKIFLCLDLILWFVRTLYLFSAFERLGPKLLMIFNTMRDLSFFLCFILVFLCGFSITSWSLLSSAGQINWIYNDDGKLLNITISVDKQNTWTWQLLRDIAQYGVWKVFGQVDPIGGTDSYSNIAFILAIIFVAIANILLLNVLIALFNVTIQNVQEKSHDLWRYQRFLIVSEFSKKPILPAPFNLLYYAFCMIRFVVMRINQSRSYQRSITTEVLLDDVKTTDDEIQGQFRISDEMRRETAIAEDYWHDVFKLNKKGDIETTLQNLEQKIDLLQEKKKTTTTNHHPSNKRLHYGSDV
ncbi:unnamed protein product [Adineta ricciae]|uniref:Uncharacterized protein n=1 Tax=Adineta ricciae TaxID=249248 RepID=A0A813QWP0_ADIRI|nr:unnamed protein product [Adineta ricciae]CAF1216581.1 unnamed protein product [Adineta ricciae]